MFMLHHHEMKTPIMMISLEYNNNDSLVLQRIKRSFLDINEDDIDRIRILGQEKAKDWVQLAIMKSGKIGRNDYCPCGSGKRNTSIAAGIHKSTLLSQRSMPNLTSWKCS